MALIKLSIETPCQIAIELNTNDYSSSRLACRTTSRIGFETFAKNYFSVLLRLVEDPSALAKFVTSLEVHFPSSHKPKKDAQAYQEVRISQARPLLVAPLRNIIDGTPSLQNVDLQSRTCCPSSTGGWISVLEHLEAREASGLRALRLADLKDTEDEVVGTGTWEVGTRPEPQWLGLLGEPFMLDVARPPLEYMRTSTGIQYYQLGNQSSWVQGRDGIKAGLEIVVLGRPRESDTI
ncbi:hypothetical protein DOTSEDRAFT_24558 [Dothistroma septosporum NZE10]|uniref:Uncharacterized protein n=1 Tax=Dothistroma septosporum (strain NZE10 / CBS 128990) TaxID=675120 RepID=N1PQ34_DOTSN|nr:hypothetical protein DOTSEDRAFT_24558 [Dothistroma septosporum NZE10]